MGMATGASPKPCAGLRDPRRPASRVHGPHRDCAVKGLARLLGPAHREQRVAAARHGLLVVWRQ
ncbi:MAG: hypothetical protein OXU61_02545, partial [Gammaproteobacteria bacterium]|nr:hypothetical protein [Gammaproteobacteria bacterium]